MSRYICDKCKCSLDPGEGHIYPGEGTVCDECREKLDEEAAHRSFFGLTKHQQREVKRMLPGIRLGV